MKKALRTLPDVGYLLEAFDLYKAVFHGELIWKERPREHFKSDGAWKTWNTRFAGKKAGSVSKSNGYKYVGINDVYYRNHRVVWKLATFQEPPELIDHRNGDKLDNRAMNLRIATNQENTRHRNGLDASNTSGFRGVYWNKQARKWHAQIRVNRRLIHLGLFSCKYEAARAALNAREKYFGEYAGIDHNVDNLNGRCHPARPHEALANEPNQH